MRAWLLLCVAFANPAFALGTWYVSPDGGDNPNWGSTRQNPFRTLQYAVTQGTVPGDTILLIGDTWPPIDLDCSLVSPGSDVKPYTVRAETDRRILIQGDGLTPPLRVTNCTWWSFEGLDLRSADAPGATEPTGAQVRNGDHVSLRRMLLSSSNRQYPLDALLWIDGTSQYVLVEDSEVYGFHHAGIRAGGQRITVRRVYFHARGRRQQDAGAAVELSGCEGCLVENVISELSARLVHIGGGNPTASRDNRVLASISLDDHNGVLISASAGSITPPSDTELRDVVVIGPNNVGVLSQSVVGTRADRCTAWGGSNGYYTELAPGGDGGTFTNPAATFELTNSLALHARYNGIGFAPGAAASFEYTNAHDNGWDYQPALPVDAGTRLTVDAGTGHCKVYVPDWSAMKGAGEGGSDIGATVLYRTVDGVLTSEPLWDRDGGAFPCGARVDGGVNDLAGQSCFDVHQRLDVDTARCRLPDAYVSGDGGIDGGQDAGFGLRSAYGLRCSTAGLTPMLWLALVLLRRLRADLHQRRES